MKKIILVLICILIICGVVGCAERAEPIAATPDIMQIRSICNLATLECYYHNVAKSEKEAGKGLLYIGEVDRKFWIEYTGTAKIGIDMSQVDMKIEGENVVVYIPNAELLSIDIDERELNEDSYISSGDSWFNKNKITAEDQALAINNAQEKMAESVKKNSALLINAQNRAKELIENYIVQLGEASGVGYKVEWVYEKPAAVNQNEVAEQK